MSRSVTKFHGFVGQRQAVELVSKLLAGARALHEPFPNCLFSGPSGVGKTRLAHAVATAWGATLHSVTGDTERSHFDRILAEVRRFDFLFVDEAHRLPPAIQEAFFGLIDHSAWPIAPKKKESRNTRIAAEIFQVEPITLICATDRPGLLANALVKRFVHRMHLQLYSVAELREIVEAIASDMDMLISAQAAHLLAEVADGLPRAARYLMEGLRLLHRGDKSQVSVEEVRDYLRDAGYHPSGLAPLQLAYLAALQGRQGLSLGSLALCLGTDTEDVRWQVEPSLHHRGLIEITSGGRKLTSSGQQFLAANARPAEARATARITHAHRSRWPSPD